MTRGKVRKNKGFTLLEVLVSITLTALVLGNIFALQSQSKRLNFKAQTNLLKTINQRAYLNVAWISNREEDAYLEELSESGFSVTNKEPLKKPEEQSKPIKYFLEAFDVVNADNNIILSSVRVQNLPINKY